MLKGLSIMVTGTKRRKSTNPHNGYNIKKLNLFLNRNLIIRITITIKADVRNSVTMSASHTLPVTFNIYIPPYIIWSNL